MGVKEKINICIVHYNTPIMTDCLIKSILKYTKDSNIYIFDNSDRFPFVNTYDNVTVFDNTKGQIIDFNKWLENYPNRTLSSEATHTYGSAKHCYSIQKCMELINKNFILLDSDVLLKTDISSLYDNEYVYIGETEKQRFVEIKRVLPFVCFINVEACKKYNIRYFDDKYMHGLYTSKNGDMYDTGGAFFIHASKYPHKDIKVNDYITHYKGGSWETGKHNLTGEEWLLKNYDLWGDSIQPKKVIYTCITGNYDRLIEPSVITPGFDYICFTDNDDLKSKTWKIKKIPLDKLPNKLNNVKIQRWVKINPHILLNDYELSIWVDANIEINGNLDKYINTINDTPNKSVYIPKHPQRNCIYEEAKICEILKKDTHENISKQIKFYEYKHYPKNYGLVQSNIIIRKHNDEYCKKLMKLWWDEINKFSHRDQLSFNYCLFILGDQGFEYLNENTCNSITFKWRISHNNQNILKKSSLKSINNPIRVIKKIKPIKIKIP